MDSTRSRCRGKEFNNYYGSSAHLVWLINPKENVPSSFYTDLNSPAKNVQVKKLKCASVWSQIPHPRNVTLLPQRCSLVYIRKRIDVCYDSANEYLHGQKPVLLCCPAAFQQRATEMLWPLIYHMKKLKNAHNLFTDPSL